MISDVQHEVRLVADVISGITSRVSEVKRQISDQTKIRSQIETQVKEFDKWSR